MISEFLVNYCVCGKMVGMGGAKLNKERQRIIIGYGEINETVLIIGQIYQTNQNQLQKRRNLIRI